MLTGTPLDQTAFGSLLTGIGWFYWALAMAGLWWALRGSRPRNAKALGVLTVLLVFGLLPGVSLWRATQARSTLDAATAHFRMRCEDAGETIKRIVEDVDGVLLLNIRPQDPNYSCLLYTSDAADEL